MHFLGNFNYISTDVAGNAFSNFNYCKPLVPKLSVNYCHPPLLENLFRLNYVSFPVFVNGHGVVIL